jgi:uncharacterized protein YyaL (SSP411 family)
MNRLTESTSPYLLQHADNPVHWWPWCEQALALAREQDRPILLSIGYSACHWCHVMAHESFEDESTAKLMNELFVNIKVDREERPDLDRIYQLAHQAIARRAGGWPLTMFLAPTDQTPFFGGTYFPPQQRHGLPAFRDLLTGVSTAWQDQREELLTQNQSMRQFLAEVAAAKPGTAEPSLEVVPDAISALARIFDPQHGGFGGAPKFPHPSHIELLLAAAESAQPEDRERCLNMSGVSLTKMAQGGIFDHLGGGFCRYAVDGMWMIPHFEKMAYDNALLLPLYAFVSRHNDEPLFESTTRATGQWVQARLQGDHGGYLASWDADSEGSEGLYYVWSADQIKAELSTEEWSIAAPHWGLDRPANFEGKAWHLHIFETEQALSSRLDIEQETVSRLLESARQKLLEQRAKRVPPGCDDKVLASWNGLMIGGMAAAGRRLARPDFVDSAQRAADFLHANLWVDGRLLATWRAGKGHLNAYLDDYAFLAWGLTELLQARWRDQDLAFAQELMEAMLARFEDAEHGGFLFTSQDHESLIQRPRPFQDEALPAGNAIAARCLIRLGHLLAEPRYLAAAERTLKLAWEEVRQAPHAYSTLLIAALDWFEPADQVILRGGDLEIAGQVADQLGPRATVFAIPDDSREADRFPMKGGFTAYRCSGSQCSAPFSTASELLADLD